MTHGIYHTVVQKKRSNHGFYGQLRRTKVSKPLFKILIWNRCKSIKELPKNHLLAKQMVSLGAGVGNSDFDIRHWR